VWWVRGLLAGRMLIVRFPWLQDDDLHDLLWCRMQDESTGPSFEVNTSMFFRLCVGVTLRVDW
jgi:hypothetical protein